MTHDNIDIEFQPEPDRLYAHNRRQLSAMLDGELSPDQARFMLRRLQHDGELAACWERWQVCGDVLRGRGHALLPADFSKRVAAAIAAPDEAARAAPGVHAARTEVRRPHGLLRWGGGALAASVALVAMFMARQMPGTPPAQLAEATGTTRQAEAAVDAPRRVAAIDGAAAGVARDVSTDVPAAPAQRLDGGGPTPALLAGAAPVVIAAADASRRSGERGSTRSQAQRAALRRGQGTGPAPVVAVASTPARGAAPAMTPRGAGTDAGLPSLAGLPEVAPPQGEALFGGPAATPRPWPRAVLPGLSRSQPFAAGYGLPEAEAFAPFHPRLDDRRLLPARQGGAPASQDPPAGPPAATPRLPGLD